MDLNPSKDIHSLFRNSIAIEESKKSEAQRFSTIIYNHDYDFDQFWDYEVPLLIYYAKYSGVLQNVYNEMLYFIRFFVFNLANKLLMSDFLKLYTATL